MKKIFFLVFLLPILGLTPCYSDDFSDGKDYEVLNSPIPSISPAQNGIIEVVEFFWYGCPHCWGFEKNISSWKKTKTSNINFITIPATYLRMPDLLFHSKLYYIAQALSVELSLRAKIFSEIHENNNPLNTREKIRDFFVSNGVDKNNFISIYKSKQVYNKIKLSRNFTMLADISSVPSIIVAGKYKITPKQAGSDERVINIMTFLINKELQLLKEKQFKSSLN
ncbi:MAG: thiol:disulfide interchange protein DsbA/DsbL [Methylococcales bacterium]